MNNKYLYFFIAAILSFVGCTIQESWVLIPITVISILSIWRFLELDNQQ